MHPKALTDVWRDLVNGPDKSWVLFANGTCVLLTEPQADLAAQATELLREWGPVAAGSSFGDFSVLTLADGKGWAVTCHHDDILTYVGPDDFDGEPPDDLPIGLLGRSRRGQDAEELQVIHVEDRRPPE